MHIFVANNYALLISLVINNQSARKNTYTLGACVTHTGLSSTHQYIGDLLHLGVCCPIGDGQPLRSSSGLLNWIRLGHLSNGRNGTQDFASIHIKD